MERTERYNLECKTKIDDSIVSGKSNCDVARRKPLCAQSMASRLLITFFTHQKVWVQNRSQHIYNYFVFVNALNSLYFIRIHVYERLVCKFSIYKFKYELKTQYDNYVYIILFRLMTMKNITYIIYRMFLCLRDSK